MKGIVLISMIMVLTACTYRTKNDINTQQPTKPSAVITTPVYYDPAIIVREDPTEVTTTTVDDPGFSMN